MPASAEHLLDLLVAVESGQATEEECAALHAMLFADSGTRDLAATLLIDELLLRSELQFQSAVDLYAPAHQPRMELEFDGLTSSASLCTIDASTTAAPKRRLLRLLLAALSGLTLLVLASWYWRPAGGEQPLLVGANREAPHRPVSAIVAEPLVGVARASAGTVATWNDQPLEPVGPLQAGTLQVKTGELAIDLSSGVCLRLTAPCQVVVGDDSAATLVAGTMLFHNDVIDHTFNLETPHSLLIDTGTSFAIQVDAQGEQIQVFDGEVWRTSRGESGRIDFLHQGDNLRFDRRPHTVETARVAAPLVTFDSPAAVLQRTPVKHPRVVENFEYTDFLAIASQSANGGEGWDGPWRLSPATRDDIPLDPVVVSAHPVTGEPGVQASGHAVLLRTLAQPVRLDRDGMVYVALRFRFVGEPPAEQRTEDSVSISLVRPLDELQPFDRILCMVRGDGRFIGTLGPAVARAELPVNFNEDMVAVWKLVTRAVGPDQLLGFAAPVSRMTPVEPPDWEIVSPPTSSNDSLTGLTLRLKASDSVLVTRFLMTSDWSDIIR